MTGHSDRNDSEHPQIVDLRERSKFDHSDLGAFRYLVTSVTSVEKHL
jgi:hypothetical protein